MILMKKNNQKNILCKFKKIIIQENCRISIPFKINGFFDVINGIVNLQNFPGH